MSAVSGAAAELAQVDPDHPMLRYIEEPRGVSRRLQFATMTLPVIERHGIERLKSFRAGYRQAGRAVDSAGRENQG